MKLIIEKLHAAAFYLTKHPEATAEEVGQFVGASKRTIERWSQTAEWQTALDNLGFKGDRNWRRNPHRDIERDAGEDFKRVKSTFFQVIEEGTHPRNAARQTAQRTGIHQRRIDGWAKRYGWREESRV